MRELWGLLRQGDVQTLLRRYGDIALAALVVAIVGMMIVPLPTWLLDLLITGNITLAVVILLVTLYVADALRFAAFPTVLLITTLYRLALNVSSTRLILLQADAGQVIRSFGEFVVRGNFVVGAVIFLILTIIQFVVISKGSERVAEVAARFTLDAMPGKQMSIDADLRAGAYDLDEARRRRAALQRESQLYGAMDGAMKFVKGDAIAGIIITVINITAGLIIGVAMRGLELGEAAKVYSILTIGDGLVSQIPALLISTAAGMIVTRVASEEAEGGHLGHDIGAQILEQPRALAIAAVLLGLLAFVGLPTVPFLVLAVVTGAVAFALLRRRRGAPTAGAAAEGRRGGRGPRALPDGRPAPRELSPGVTPIALEVSPSLTPLIDAETEQGRLIAELIPKLRESLFAELGVPLPGVRVRGHAADLPDGGYRIRLQEIPMAEGRVPAGRVLAAEAPDRLAAIGLGGEPAVNPTDGAAATWIDPRDRETCEGAGILTFDGAQAVLLHLGAVLRRYAYEFVGIQETQQLLEQFERTHPALVREITPKPCSPQLIADVLRRLVEEGVSIRNLRGILQALAEWAPVEKDPVLLTEYVRMALRRYITHKYAGGSPTLVVYLLDPPIEEAVRGAVQHTSSGSYLALEPELSGDILAAVRRELGGLPSGAQPPVILTQMEIRRYVRRLIEVEHPEVAVLSYQELAPELNIQPVGRIRLAA